MNMSIGKQENAIGRQPAYSRYLSSAIFLLLGLCTSAIIYLTSGDVSDSVSIYEVEESRKYLHDLEFYAQYG